MDVCIYHIAEIFLFEYYENPSDYTVIPKERLEELRKKAGEEMKRGGYVAALQNYDKAQELNPADAEVRLSRIRCCYHLGRLEEMHEETLRLYPYACTRQELAAYYRWLGCWYLEKYQPELSECVYRYSTLFAPSEQAEEEIRYLEKALGKKMPAYPLAEMQDKLREAGIPLHASDVTMALLVKAGEEAETRRLWQQALDCYRMVFDLTQDEEIGRRIRRLS